MKRIDHTTVELTNSEMAAMDHFDRCLDQGMGIADAVAEVRKARWYHDLSDEFYAYMGS